jgi:hypothetical protein
MNFIYTPAERPLLRQHDDLFTSTGTHVARVYGKIACGPSGRYIGTLDQDRLVFENDDCLESRPMFVRLSHTGFAYDNSTSLRTIDGEPNFVE